MTNTSNTPKRNTLAILNQMKSDLINALAGYDDGYHLERKTRLKAINKRIEEVEAFTLD